MHLCCRALADAPKLENEASLLTAAQAAQSDAEPREAIECLRQYLVLHNLSLAESHEIDRERFLLLKQLTKIKQKDLATRIGVTPSKLCQFEKGKKELDLSSLLLAAEVFGVEPRQIVGGNIPSLMDDEVESAPTPRLASVHAVPRRQRSGSSER